MGAYVACNTAGIRSVVYNSSPLTYDNFGRAARTWCGMGRRMFLPGSARFTCRRCTPTVRSGQPAMGYSRDFRRACRGEVSLSGPAVHLLAAVHGGCQKRHSYRGYRADRRCADQHSARSVCCPRAGSFGLLDRNLMWADHGMDPVVFGAYDTGATKYGTSLAPLYSTNFPGAVCRRLDRFRRRGNGAAALCTGARGEASDRPTMAWKAPALTTPAIATTAPSTHRRSLCPAPFRAARPSC